MAIWNLPESARLEAQTLDKLSTAPWRLLTGVTPPSNAPSVLLRPLLDDLVHEECYLEVSGDTNRPTEFVLAIRLPAARAALWETNLPVILRSLAPTGGEGRARGQSAAGSPTSISDFRLELCRSGDWTLLSVQTPSPHPMGRGQGEGIVGEGSRSRGEVSPSLNPQPSANSPALGPQTSDLALLTSFRSRIARDHAPFSPRATNYWLEASADLHPFAPLLPFLSAFRDPVAAVRMLPRISLSMIGETGNVRTLASAEFPGPLPMDLDSWKISTNLVHDPVVGFTAVRGFRSLLQALALWDESRFGLAPSQACFWTQDGKPDFRFFTIPTTQSDASNQVNLLSEFLIRDVNPRFALLPGTTNLPFGSFQRVPGSPGVRWRGFPYFSPNLGLTEIASNTFITGGLSPNRGGSKPVPSSLLNQLDAENNLVLYDWEQPRITNPSLIQMAQTARMVFGRNRLSLTNNPAQAWLVAVNPRLETAGTSARLVKPNCIRFSRTSTLGLTGLELHLLVDWLESSTFPVGLFTLETPRSTRPTPRSPDSSDSP
jgi:hypothetical protein